MKTVQALFSNKKTLTTFICNMTLLLNKIFRAVQTLNYYLTEFL